MVQTVEERWEGYTLHLTVAAVGQTITAQARVEEQTIEVRVALPWLLAMLAGGVRQGIEQHARDLLLPPAKPRGEGGCGRGYVGRSSYRRLRPCGGLRHR
jgi:hypothetical protein